MKINTRIIQFLEKFYYYPKFLIEFLVVITVVLLANLLPFRFASWLFGFLFSILGPLLPPSKRIENNLRLAYPLMDENFVKSMTKKIWFNTGRFMGETPFFLLHKWRFFKKFVTVEGLENLSYNIENGKPVMLISAHIGNWWFAGKLFEKMKFKMYSIYRAPNNPLIKFMWKSAAGPKLAKGTPKMRDVISVVKSNNILSIFQDHRDRDGISLPFLGQNAMTSTFFAKFALKYKMPVIYAICVRDKIKQTNFTLKFETLYDPKDKLDLSIEDLTLLVNNKLSRDIHENREQWFWLHKRWKM